jgi:hypothetical protein
VDIDRRRRIVSFLAIAAPIGLLAVAWVADRIFHHTPRIEVRWTFRPAVPSERLPSAGSDVAASLEESGGDVFEEIIGCGAPDSVEACGPESFEDRFAERLEERESRGALERRWLAELADGDHVAAYGLAWLGSKAALPELRRQLLTDRYFCGWETSTPDPPDAVYADDQYPHHQAFIVAIEAISGRSLRGALKLSAAERAQLRKDSAGCDDWRAAVWLLHKLDGVPLPRTKVNRAKRIACEGPWLPGDPGYVIDE